MVAGGAPRDLLRGDGPSLFFHQVLRVYTRRGDISPAHRLVDCHVDGGVLSKRKTRVVINLFSLLSGLTLVVPRFISYMFPFARADTRADSRWETYSKYSFNTPIVSSGKSFIKLDTNDSARDLLKPASSSFAEYTR